MIQLKDVSLIDFTTIKIGGIAKFMVFPQNESEFLEAYKTHKNDNIFILGKGSNVLFGDYDGVIINTKYFNSIYVKEEKNKVFVKASSGTPLKDIIRIAIEKNLDNIYKLTGFPASVGGAIAMNAGAYNVDIFDFIKGVWYIEDKEIVYKKKEDIQYTYRHTEFENKPVLYGEFVFEKTNANIKGLVQEINQKRQSTQPLNTLTSGSTFKNPKNHYAGKLLEEAGLKGYRLKDIGFSPKHANFLVNYQNSTLEDVKNLLEYAKEKVFKAFNIILEEEIKLICA